MVFLTSSKHDGDFGGISQADTICNSLAQSAGIDNTGTFKAWLSDANTSAKDRLTHSNLPYKLVSGETIADNWNDLIDGTISHIINVNEDGTVYIPAGYAGVWTATKFNGDKYSIYPQDYCGWWSNDFGLGIAGLLTSTDSSWTNAQHSWCDSQSGSFYCFEQ